MSIISSTKIYDALKSLGLARNHVKVILPDWWSREVEDAQDGVYELALLLSRRLNLSFEALLDGKAIYKDADTHVAYKHSTATNRNTLRASTQIARALANTVVECTTAHYHGLPSDINEIENQIRQISTDGVLDLVATIKFCWQAGIPVIPLTFLPKGTRKMDGASMLIGGRPVIVVSRQSRSKSWLHFILAHELGHIFSCHLNANDVLIDDQLELKISQSAGEEQDEQEREANDFALNLLGGSDVEEELNSWGKRMAATEIAIKAMEYENAKGHPAGHIALRYARLYDRWPEVQTALNFINSDKYDGIASDLLLSSIDLDKLGEDSEEVVLRLTKYYG